MCEICERYPRLNMVSFKDTNSPVWMVCGECTPDENTPGAIVMSLRLTGADLDLIAPSW